MGRMLPYVGGISGQPANVGDPGNTGPTLVLLRTAAQAEVWSMDFEFDRVVGRRVIKCLEIEGVAVDPPYDLAQGADSTQCNTGPWAGNDRIHDFVLR